MRAYGTLGPFEEGGGPGAVRVFNDLRSKVTLTVSVLEPSYNTS